MEAQTDDVHVDQVAPLEGQNVDSFGETQACCSTAQDLGNAPFKSTPDHPNIRGARRPLALFAPGALFFIGAGCFIAKLVKAFRCQQRELSEACRQLRSAQEQLMAKERSMEQNEARRKAEQEARAAELGQQVADAQRELASARKMCRQAAAKLEQSMSDLCVTETELRSARTQLHSASRDLALTTAQLEATEGELGLTRSQNELMKREVDILRRQLREAGQQLEGYIRVSRARKNEDASVGRGGGNGDFGDDLAATVDWGY